MPVVPDIMIKSSKMYLLFEIVNLFKRKPQPTHILNEYIRRILTDHLRGHTWILIGIVSDAHTIKFRISC